MWLGIKFFWYMKPRYWIIFFFFLVSEGIYYLRKIGKRLISEAASHHRKNEKSWRRFFFRNLDKYSPRRLHNLNLVTVCTVEEPPVLFAVCT